MLKIYISKANKIIHKQFISINTKYISTIFMNKY